MRGRVLQFGVVAAALVALSACAAKAPAEHTAAAPAGRGGDVNWSDFDGANDPIDPKNVRVVPESPIEITGVPYIRAIRLSWSNSENVPAFEPDNQTLELPADVRQAVLLVSVFELPPDADVHVDWYFGKGKVFSDGLESRDDGDHYFALVKRDGRRLDPLPKGEYRAELYNGSTLIKSIQFKVQG